MLAAWVYVALLSQALIPPGPIEGPGITVEAGGQLLHRVPVRYPPEAMQAKVGGTVVLELTLDSEGAVSDARVLAGPPELRRGALESALQWHYLRGAATVQATIEFRPPDSAPPSISAAIAPMRLGTDYVLESIDVSALPELLKSLVRTRLASFQGQGLSPGLLMKITEAAKGVDRHLIVAPRPTNTKSVTVAVLLPGTSPVPTTLQGSLPPAPG